MTPEQTLEAMGELVNHIERIRRIGLQLRDCEGCRFEAEGLGYCIEHTLGRCYICDECGGDWRSCGCRWVPF